MFSLSKLINVTSWERVAFSTGSRRGYWVRDISSSEGKTGLIKMPRLHSTYTRWEVGAEITAARLGEFLSLNIASVEPVVFENQLCSISWDFRPSNYELREGVDLSGSGSDRKNLAIAEIIDVLSDYCDRKTVATYVINMICFDILIGNPDRHQGNWGVLIPGDKNSKPRLAPYYDHGASLGSILPERQLARVQAGNFAKFDRDFRYRIAVDGVTRAKPRIAELLEAVKMIGRPGSKFMDRLDALDCQTVEQLLDSQDIAFMLSDDRREFITSLISHRRELILRGMTDGI